MDALRIVSCVWKYYVPAFWERGLCGTQRMHARPCVSFSHCAASLTATLVQVDGGKAGDVGAAKHVPNTVGLGKEE